MGIAQFWNSSANTIATVNSRPCHSEIELQRILRQVLSERRSPIEIAIHEPAAQRAFLPLAMYSPEELLPQGVGNLVGDIRRAPQSKSAMQKTTQGLGISLAISNAMDAPQSRATTVIGAAVISAINKGYGTVSFGTNARLSTRSNQSGAVLILMSE